MKCEYGACVKEAKYDILFDNGHSSSVCKRHIVDRSKTERAFSKSYPKDISDVKDPEKRYSSLLEMALKKIR